MLSDLPGVYAAVGDLDQVEGRFDRLSFVLPLLHPWSGRDPQPVHTHASSPDLLERTLRALPRLLDHGGRAVLYAQHWVPGGEVRAVLGEAFGGRPWTLRFTGDHTGSTDVGRVQTGVFEVVADGVAVESRTRL
jgi:hypothetical protein